MFWLWRFQILSLLYYRLGCSNLFFNIVQPSAVQTPDGNKQIVVSKKIYTNASERFAYTMDRNALRDKAMDAFESVIGEYRDHQIKTNGLQPLGRVYFNSFFMSPSPIHTFSPPHFFSHKVLRVDQPNPGPHTTH